MPSIKEGFPTEIEKRLCSTSLPSVPVPSSATFCNQACGFLAAWPRDCGRGGVLRGGRSRLRQSRPPCELELKAILHPRQDDAESVSLAAVSGLRPRRALRLGLTRSLYHRQSWPFTCGFEVSTFSPVSNILLPDRCQPSVGAPRGYQTPYRPAHGYSAIENRLLV